MLDAHLLSVEDFHGAGELHAPWSGDTLHPVLWGPGNTEL
jgi:hypothetical protein